MDEKGKKEGIVSEIVKHISFNFVSIHHNMFWDGDTEVITGERLEKQAGGHKNYIFKENIDIYFKKINVCNEFEVDRIYSLTYNEEGLLKSVFMDYEFSMERNYFG